MPTASRWEMHFGPSYAPPQPVLDALSKKRVRDFSSPHDVCPAFGLTVKGPTGEDHELRLWVEHPRVEERKSGSVARFFVTASDYDIAEPTDDVVEALDILLNNAKGLRAAR